MIWGTLAAIMKVTILGWFLIVGLFLLYKIMTNGIGTDGLLRHAGEDHFGFHRAQLMAFTLLFAIGYVMFALRQPAAAGMPDISTPMLAALLGSHAAYLGGKLLNQGG